LFQLVFNPKEQEDIIKAWIGNRPNFLDLENPFGGELKMKQ